MIKIALAASMLSISVPAMAVTANPQADIMGIWSTAEGCDAITKRKKQADYWPKNFETITYLSSRGVDGYEWSCEFLDIKRNSTGQMVIPASCSAEGESWAELFLVEYYAPDGWRVINRPDGKGVNVMSFPRRCDD